VLSAPTAGYLKLDIRHTDDLKVGDQIQIDFPFGSAGYFVFGGDETFTVTEAAPGKGVRFVDESGATPTRIPMPIYGTYDQLRSKLEEKTRVNSIDIYRAPGGSASSSSYAFPALPEESAGGTGGEVLRGYKPSGIAVSDYYPGMLLSTPADQGLMVIAVDSIEPLPESVWKTWGHYRVNTHIVGVPESRKKDIGTPINLVETDIPGHWSAWEVESRFPWFLIALGLAAAGVAIYLYYRED
jgi:hypothetical protein